jgi:hypothetical protein
MKQKFLIALAGAVFGGLLVGAFGYLQRLKTEHHYREIETFFRGTVAGKEVLGISYFEYDGIGFMEWNQWKVLMAPRADGTRKVAVPSKVRSRSFEIIGLIYQACKLECCSPWRQPA